MGESLNKMQNIFLRLVRHRAYAIAFNVIQKTQPADLAILFYYLSEKEKKWFADSILKSHKLALVISEMEDDIAAQFVSLISEQNLIDALEAMKPDDAADLLLALDEKQRQNLLKQLTKLQRAVVSKLLGFAPDTAGGVMTTDFLALPEDISSQKAIEFLKQQEIKSEILYIYVINNHEQLVGVVSFKELVLSKGDKKLSELMKKEPVSVTVEQTQEDASSMIARYNLLSLPVVDDNHRLVGQITVDDAIDVLYEEATEDIYHLANLSTEEHVSTSTMKSTRLRFPWLAFNLLTCILAALVISLFEKTISQYIVLAAFLPVIAGMGGNAGTQSLVVVVRGLALGEIDWRLGFKIVFKEIKIGLLNGLSIGLIMALIAFLWYHNLGLSVIIFLAMIGNLIIAGLFGALVPLVLRKLKLDPALGSSIFVTTATDIGGFILFLGLATLLIKFIV